MSRAILYALALCLLLAQGAATAQNRTPADLLDEGALVVNTRLQPDTNIVPGQKLALVLEVSTNRWFTGGTRIIPPEVPGLVILQTESFASNASEQRDGESWVVQRWTLDVYPQREGQFVLPPVDLEVKVNDAQAGNLSGRIQAPGLSFTVTTPAALVQADFWVAAPEFNISQRFDRDLDGLVVGDAIEREIRFQASDVMAMMLPSFEPELLDGLKAYPLPPQLDEQNDRGELTATRVESISYIVQAAGSYTLPAREFLWWNTRSGELELLELPAVSIQVSAASSAKAGYSTIWLGLAITTLVLLSIIAVLWVLRRQLARLPWQRLVLPLRNAIDVVRSLREPALPRRLNPDNSAGE